MQEKRTSISIPLFFLELVTRQLKVLLKDASAQRVASSLIHLLMSVCQNAVSLYGFWRGM